MPAVNSRDILDRYSFSFRELYQQDMNNHKGGRCLYGAGGGASVTSARVALGRTACVWKPQSSLDGTAEYQN